MVWKNETLWWKTSGDLLYRRLMYWMVGRVDDGVFQSYNGEGGGVVLGS